MTLHQRIIKTASFCSDSYDSQSSLFSGLVENSSVVLVASMLVSPLMGPILAIVFGTAVRNRKLVRIGLKRELYSLLICILCGFIFGCIFVVKFNRTRSMLAITTSSNWPTIEMASRTGWSCLVVGVAVAVPSGLGVAISVLGGNSGSMVGEWQLEWNVIHCQ